MTMQLAKVDGPDLVSDYIGFLGCVALDRYPLALHTTTARVGDPIAPSALTDTSRAVQLIHPHAIQPVEHLSQLIRNEHLQLSGLINRPNSWSEFSSQLADALCDGRNTDLASLVDNFAGCLLADHQIFLFKGLNCVDNIYYRKDGTQLLWSTDPSDLWLNRQVALRRDAVRSCCMGDDAFIFADIEWVPAGHLVIAGRTQLIVKPFDQYVPIHVPRNYSLQEYATLARHLMLRATRAAAHSGRVGVMLSGGIDSSSVLAALVEQCADLIAYHWDVRDIPSNEAKYAQAVCQHLGVPLVRIPLTVDEDYLPRDWRFSLPSNHNFYRWFEATADRAVSDGINILATGIGGDTVFGLGSTGKRDIGFVDIIKSKISWHEKLHMCLHRLAAPSRNTMAMLQRARRTWLVEDGQRQGSMLELPFEHFRSADFLVPESMTGQRRRGLSPWLDANLFRVEFAALDLALWRPRGIRTYHPYLDKQLVGLGFRLPDAYRRFWFQGRQIGKPILKLAFSDRLPPEVVRRTGLSVYSSPVQRFCLHHSSVLWSLLGSPDSCLLTAGIVSKDRLATVLADRRLTCFNASALVASAMIELFLRGLQAQGMNVAWR